MAKYNSLNGFFEEFFVYFRGQATVMALLAFVVMLSIGAAPALARCNYRPIRALKDYAQGKLPEGMNLDSDADELSIIRFSIYPLKLASCCVGPA